MNLLWRDNFGSFLDSLAPGASGDSASFTGSDGQAVLWSGGDTSGGGTGQDTLWTEPGSGAATWQLAGNAGTAGVAGLGDGSLSAAAATFPSDVGSLIWQGTLFVFEEVSATAHSSTLDSTLNQILDVVWNATGGAGSPPVTLPHAPSNPFADGFPPISLPPSGLAWTGQPPLHGWFPDGTGQPPLIPPVAGNSPLAGIWTDLSAAVPPLLDGQGLTGVVPPTLFSRS
jgi:hypothetical protein